MYFGLIAAATALASAAFMLALGARERRPALALLGAVLASLGLLELGLALPRLGLPEAAAGAAAKAAFAASASGELLYLAAAPLFYRAVFGFPRSPRGERLYAAIAGSAFGAALVLIVEAAAAARTAAAASDSRGIALGALLFGEIAAGLLIGLARVRGLVDPLPRRFLRRFFLLTLAFFPFMAVDSIGSSLRWAWIAGFDDLSLPAFLIVVSALVAREGRLWSRPLPPPAEALESEGPEAAAEGSPASVEASAAPPDASAEAWALLTEREAAIARRILSGESSKEIGSALGISAKTAENHSYRIFKKVGAHSRLQLYRILGPGSSS